jgi:hypothetical protein
MMHLACAEGKIARDDRFSETLYNSLPNGLLPSPGYLFQPVNP